MNNFQPRSGYTLPVFACAAALAALRCLHNSIIEKSQDLDPIDVVLVDLIAPTITAEVPIEQVALLRPGMALAVTRSDPGDNLDLTRNTPIWAMVELMRESGEEEIVILGGYGIGYHKTGGDAAIYSYARQLLEENIRRSQRPGEKITVTIILPEGRQLATRTSNEAFGVVEGLSLLGTTGISQPLSSPDQLAVFRSELQSKVDRFDCLVFCIGENGLDLARKLGINPDMLVKTANWLGPMLVEAGVQNFQSILLFGYHGKLMKLAGGIFHTHHHLADGRREILTAFCARMGVPAAICNEIWESATAEDALKQLRALDENMGSNWVSLVYGAIASQIDQRASDYIFTHSERRLTVGSLLFSRDRQIILKSEIGDTILSQIC
ncbi:cobalt-precorrin-5B (C(1))-methyltransferase [Oscillatoriales cyanobacterium USR001]|nr:cobalt-precorrin-5B (C(1))-methyltransferase [Oscillatoriales cyanobacterium USR001]